MKAGTWSTQDRISPGHLDCLCPHGGKMEKKTWRRAVTTLSEAWILPHLKSDQPHLPCSSKLGGSEFLFLATKSPDQYKHQRLFQLETKRLFLSPSHCACTYAVALGQGLVQERQERMPSVPAVKAAAEDTILDIWLQCLEKYFFLSRETKRYFPFQKYILLFALIGRKP